MRSKAACLSVAALATVAIAACQRQPSPEPAEKVAPPAAAPQPPAPIAAPQPVDRSELLRSLDTAASVYAAGKAPEGEVLTGRRFTVRQAFGCTGPAPPPPADLAADGLPRWSWGSERRTIEIRLTPSDWAKSALIAGNDGAWEAAEGFWLTRPWLRADGCPAPRVPRCTRCTTTR